MKLRSHQALRDYMTFYKINTGYALAKRAGILPGTANFLVQGHRDTCSSRTALAIEQALACPPGFLFEPAGREARR
ncbi:helix-turn-helix domain-containing protein [Microlunatus parietis]|uniref:DNA-binding Xre family transcriptional regulator n=1 Tax=Microlunatus parietis TaxID=682979 RepID=A0A7Y9LBA6_9ACTN|nr:helix-turn-helix domain-containing protein [Microlunatus parietis]NYE69616.1 DNA-binding Xre family transcriptional regulator [Microlunatus parietis]